MFSKNKIIILLVSLILQSCQVVDPNYKQAEKTLNNTSTVVKKIINQEQIYKRQEGPLVIEEDDFYVADLPIRPKKTVPAFFDNPIKIDITNNQAPLTTYVEYLQNLTNITFYIQQDVYTYQLIAPPITDTLVTTLIETESLIGGREEYIPIILTNPRKVSGNFTLTSYLDKLLKPAGLHWEYDSDINQISIKRFITKEYLITAMQSSYHFFSEVTFKDQGIHYEGRRQLWDTIEKNIPVIIGQHQGHIASYPDLGMLVVTATPEIHQQIARQIDIINQQFSIGIVIHINIYTLEIEGESNLGINWDLIFQDTNLAIRGSSARTLFDTTNSLVASIPAGSTNAIKNWQGSQFFIDLLSRVGRAAQIYHSAVRPLNGELVVLKSSTEIPVLRGTKSIIVNDVGVSEEQFTEKEEIGLQMQLLAQVSPDHRKILLLGGFELATADFPVIFSKAEGDLIASDLQISRDATTVNTWLKPNETLIFSLLSRKQVTRDKQGLVNPSLWYLGGGQSAENGYKYIIVTMRPQIEVLY